MSNLSCWISAIIISCKIPRIIMKSPAWYKDKGWISWFHRTIFSAFSWSCTSQTAGSENFTRC